MSSASLRRTQGAVFAALLLLACAHGPRAAADGAGAPAGPVALRFGWPDGLQLLVIVAQEFRRGASEPTGLVARQRLVAERVGDELRVVSRDVAARGTEPDLDALVKISEALVQVVTTDGKFRRAEGLDAALEAADPASAEERESIRRAFIRSSESEWDVLVGAWAGERLRAGDVRHKQVRGSVPLLGTVETLLDVEYGLEGRVPCTDDETERRCVLLSYRAHLSPGDHAATVERLRRQSGATPGGPIAEDVHAEADVQVVTEPDTLVPHRMSQRELLRLRVHLPDGHVREAEQRLEARYLFTRPPAAAEEPEPPSTGL